MELNQRYVRRRNMSLSNQGNTKPFQHTLKWNMMLQHFYDNISLKRRKIGPEQSCMCFTGSNAVNVLFTFLKKNRTLFSSCESIKRSNIVSLCNLYLQTGNIEVVRHVSMSPKRRNKFKDSSSNYYCFTERAMSTLVQHNQIPVHMKKPNELISLGILSDSTDTMNSITSRPLSKHGSVESLFQRIQKNGVRRASNPKTSSSPPMMDFTNTFPSRRAA